MMIKQTSVLDHLKLNNVKHLCYLNLDRDNLFQSVYQYISIAQI